MSEGANGAPAASSAAPTWRDVLFGPSRREINAFVTEDLADHRAPAEPVKMGKSRLPGCKGVPRLFASRIFFDADHHAAPTAFATDAAASRCGRYVAIESNLNSPRSRSTRASVLSRPR